MPNQKIKEINIDELSLWSENPRDPMESNFSDFEIIKQAVSDPKTKWNLPRLLEEMGPHYDFSELPTVVSIDNKYVIFDGNRRIAVLKYLQNEEIFREFSSGNFLQTESQELLKLKKIPCNVCTKKTALDNIERKHANSGSWSVLDRDFFLFKHRNQSKSIFLMIDEATGLISENNELNKRFVKDEVFTEINLKSIGFKVKNDKLISVYSKEDAQIILTKLVDFIKSGKIKTRTDEEKGTIRVATGKLKEAMESLDPNIKPTISSYSEKNKKSELGRSSFSSNQNVEKEKPQKPSKKTPRDKKTLQNLFGKTLSLKKGNVNSIYRDISDLNQYYIKNESSLSKYFPSLIRMSMRILVEAATSEQEDISSYVSNNYVAAKTTLSQDQRTTLSNNAINTPNNLVQLLQSGAHNYTNSANFEQTIAMSIIVGAMLSTTHKK